MNVTIKHTALPSLLDRDLSKAEAKDLIDKFDPYINELINLSTKVLGRCQSSVKGIKGSPIALIALFYNAIQLSDGISVLLKEACFQVSIPLIRSLLEASLSADFMLEKDFEIRSNAWLYGYYLERIRYYESFDSNTSKGKDVSRRIKSYKFFKNGVSDILNQEQTDQQLALYRKIIEQNKFKDLKESFTKVNNKKWYQINGGPNNLRELAKHLKRLDEYEFMYRHFSSVTHANDISNLLTKVENRIVYQHIRSHKGFGAYSYHYTSHYLIRFILKFISKFPPKENIKEDLNDIFKRHKIEILEQ